MRATPLTELHAGLPAPDDTGATSITYAPPAPGTDAHRDAVRAALLAWWDAGHRDLPWRRTHDPYAILVSELMLQQTGVERVVPKWSAFMERFPTLAALAAASPADVIRMWQGLGYNRRAVNLHRLAGVVVNESDGRMPATVPELQALPGVGPYTARAVASIAFGQPAAAVDTNVRRVLTRVVEGAESARSPTGVQELADLMLAAERPGDWNQALMELGATVCTAAAPRCPVCPLRHLCAAAPHIRAVRERGERYRAPRQKAPQGAWTGSSRFYRGRVVDMLRAGEGLSPAQIGARLRLDFSDDDLSWLRGLLAGLARDGLIVWDGDDAPARLPGEGS